jgi:hypothetical protein
VDQLSIEEGYQRYWRLPFPDGSQIKSLKVAESDLIYVLNDSGTMLSIYSPEHKNDKDGLIFTLKNKQIMDFYALSSTFFPFNEPKDSVEKFKRQKKLIPLEYLLTLSHDAVVSLWNCSSHQRKLEGDCLLLSTLSLISGSPHLTPSL